MIGTAVPVCVATLTAVLLDVPEAALTSVVGAAGIVAVSLIYGRNSSARLDILDSVRGIQRP